MQTQKQALTGVDDELAMALLEAQLRLRAIENAARAGDLAEVRRLTNQPTEHFTSAISRWSKEKHS